MLTLLLGPPGGGKGTISRWLVRDFGFAHVSTGDLLRRHIAERTKLGIVAQGYVQAGDLVPDDLVMDLVSTELKSTVNPRVLLDGFPRTTKQALDVDAALNLDVPHDVIVRRLGQRWTHLPSGRSYAADFNPPKVKNKDDITGEPLVQRDDDKPEAILKRLEVYAAQTKPLLQHYDKKGVLHNFRGDKSKVIYVDVHAFVEKKLVYMGE